MAGLAGIGFISLVMLVWAATIIILPVALPRKPPVPGDRSQKSNRNRADSP
jgi:hypothetical protein